MNSGPDSAGRFRRAAFLAVWAAWLVSTTCPGAGGPEAGAPRAADRPGPDEPLAPQAPSRPGGPVRLFNGRDLSGWNRWLVDSGREDPRRVFTVNDGCIRISGDGLGYLATDRAFSGYRLEVEWRWGMTNTAWGDRVGRARDSGIFLHATGPDGNSEDGEGAFMAAIECNLFQGAVGDILLIRGKATDGTLIAPRLVAEVAPDRDADQWFTWQQGGREQALERWGRLNAATKAPGWRDLTDFRGPRDVEAPPGSWNTTVCEARADRLRIFVNGTLVNEARGLHPRHGRILLQCEGSEIFFRRVDLFRLPDTPAQAPPGPAGDAREGSGESP